MRGLICCSFCLVYTAITCIPASADNDTDSCYEVLLGLIKLSFTTLSNLLYMYVPTFTIDTEPSLIEFEFVLLLSVVKIVFAFLSLCRIDWWVVSISFSLLIFTYDELRKHFIRQWKGELHG